RVCGGTIIDMDGYESVMGLSPRVRGNPLRRPLTAPAPWDYPRVCGGTSGPLWPNGRGLGLSPRVRGNPDIKGKLCRDYGTIPACAGEPAGFLRERREKWDYPRVCGGTAKMALMP